MRALWKPMTSAAMCLLSACQMAPAQTARPALLTNPGPEVHSELVRAVAGISGFASITLAEGDLTRSSLLVIQRKPQYAHGELLQGRDLEMPQRFQLLLWQGQCWLEQLGSGKRQLLALARCRAEVEPE